jgi:hypothetical protein
MAVGIPRTGTRTDHRHRCHGETAQGTRGGAVVRWQRLKGSPVQPEMGHNRLPPTGCHRSGWGGRGAIGRNRPQSTHQASHYVRE